jgi:hypothetical protein
MFEGAHLWAATHGTVVPVLDRFSANSDPGHSICGGFGPLFDTDFIFRKIAAIMILGLGVSTFCWAVALTRIKPDYNSAAG